MSVRSLQAVIKPKTADWTNIRNKRNEKAMRGSNFPCQCVFVFVFCFLINFEPMYFFHYLHARESENRQKSKGVRMWGITA